ncbi:LCP family protein [Streptococcus ovuberis]|uniref:LCP family protein n=1 Tax=Streptococcus ovuberis TaxID=1936207 RepID=A0A7X6MVX5_9STRE|nr:LCP family protein [Streptococcus ovuberis]NKZ19392.1 LCP family protein [Streptococcus ovuberis]
MSRHRSSKQRRESWKIPLGIYVGIIVIYALIAAFFLFNAYKQHFLVLKGLSLLIPAVIIGVFLLGLLLLIWRKTRWVSAVLLLLGTIALGLGLYVQKTTETVSVKLNRSAAVSETVMSVVVPVDSEISELSQVSTVLAATDNDASNIEQLLAQVKSEKSLDLLTKPVASYQEAYEKLLAGDEKAMILNSAYGGLLETVYPDYAEKLKTLYTYTVKKEVPKEEAAAKPISQSDSFNIYVSGIDTYGPITSVSRSDVNIIMTVNRTTNQIVLTTTPRDSYVPIAGGGNNQYDKLTHSGIYGIESSIATLENLYDIDISYYARINFTSFLNLIDVLGGIEVYNDQAFSNGSGDYPVGNITLNSQQALGFARERYGLAGGDRDRGRNHNKVISAIINKLTTVGALTNFNSILSGVGDSVQTNMPLSTMMALVNDQLATGKKYTIVSQSLEGTGSTGQLPSYAMPGASLYMMSIDEASLAKVKSTIHQTLEGK